MVRRSLSGRGLAVALAMSAIFVASGVSAEVTVRVDRNPVHVNETFRITFETDFQLRREPDLTPLTGELDILNLSSNSRSVNLNGHQELAQSVVLDVMAKREGALTIPSIEFDGQQTDALTINVLPAATGDSTAGTASDFFFEISIDPEEAYVQSQLVYTVRLFYAINVSNGSLTEPAIPGGNAVIERLGDDAHFRTARDGRNYTVVERRYAVFPQASGTLRIEPLMFEGIRGGRTSMFDTFGRRGQAVRLQSEPVEIDVLPIPADFAGKDWLPARRVYLQEDWSGTTANLPVGEPVTRTVQLVAEGLRASQLPEVSPATPPGLKQYPDQAILDDKPGPTGVTGIRQEKIALIPSAPGDYEIPEIALPWFNTQTGEVEYARLPGRTLTVTGALAPPAPSVEADLPATESQIADVVSQESDLRAANIWQWLSAGLGVAWLLTLFGWLRSRNRPRPSDDAPKRSQPQTHKEIISKLKATCLANDKTSARDALLRWSTIRWPGNPATSLGEIASRLQGQMQMEIHALNRALYEQGELTWSGEPLWTAFVAEKSQFSKRKEDPMPTLAPLHRL